MRELSIRIPEGRRLDVVGLGEISFDRLLRVTEWPSPGGKLEVGPTQDAAGGQVASAILGCARLGLRAGLVGTVGDDDLGPRALVDLRRAGVDLAGVHRLPGVATRTALILVSEQTGARAVLAHRDPRLDLAEAQRESVQIECGRLLLLDATDPGAATWAAHVAREAGIPVVLDLDTCGPHAEALLAVTDFPVVTMEFAEEWGGTGHVRDGLRRLVAGGARLAVATCGAAGAVARLGERVIESPASPSRVRDTTGAGDAFHAGFVLGLLEGWSVERVLRFANATAALCCEGVGAQGALPTRAKVEAKLGD